MPFALGRRLILLFARSPALPRAAEMSEIKVAKQYGIGYLR